MSAQQRQAPPEILAYLDHDKGVFYDVPKLQPETDAILEMQDVLRLAEGCARRGDRIWMRAYLMTLRERALWVIDISKPLNKEAKS